MRGTGILGRNRMLGRLLLWVALGVGGSAGGAAQSPPMGALEQEMLKGIDRLLREDYDGAKAIFSGITHRYPNHPAGYLLEAGAMQTEAMDYEAVLKREMFDSVLTIAEEKAETMVDNREGDPEAYFYLGSVYGYRSMADATEGDWLGAATGAMASVSEFEKALERDSLLADAKLGIGTYYYWKSQKMAFLTWLPFVADDRDEGIALIKETVANGRFNRHAAMTALISIYLDAEHYEEAITISQRALSDYPRNRLYLWGLATGYDRLGEREHAIGAYRRLLEAILSDTRPNPYNELVCRVNLARLEIASGSRGQARSLLVPVLDRSPEDFPKHLRDRAERKLKEAWELGALLARP